MVFLAACDQADVPTTALTDDLEEAYLPKAGDPIPGQYIVVLKDRSEFAGKSVRAVLEEMTAAEGVETIFQYETALVGFAGKFSDAAIERVRQNPYVDYVEQDRVVTLPITIEGNKGKKPPKDGGGDDSLPEQVTPWGITRVNGGASVAGKTAWVIDTGIDLDHPDLNVDATKGFSAFKRGKDSSLDDGHGHGTHVSGTIAGVDNIFGVVGVAAGATVVPVKVLSSQGSGSLSGVIAGVDHVAANGGPGDVANMSLGRGISQALDDAVMSASSTVKFVLAAGNSSDDANNYSPARANGVNIYTISAIDIDDNFAWFSNYGNPPIDYAAPGVNVLSLYKKGGMATMSGTSMAAPHVAGILLLGIVSSDGTVIGDPDKNPDTIAIH